MMDQDEKKQIIGSDFVSCILNVFSLDWFIDLL